MARSRSGLAEDPSGSMNGVADITVVQLHWIPAEVLPELLDTLWREGLTTKGSFGDDTRH